MENYNEVIPNKKMKRISYYHSLKEFLGISEKTFKFLEIVTLEERVDYAESLIGLEDRKNLNPPKTNSWMYFGKPKKAYVKESDQPNLTKCRF